MCVIAILLTLNKRMIGFDVNYLPDNKMIYFVVMIEMIKMMHVAN